MWVMVCPWKTIPMNSAAPRRELRRSRGSVSRPSPLSTMNRCTWLVMSGAMSVVMGRAQLTVSPGLHQGGGLRPLGGGDQVQRAQLVLLSPATPVVFISVPRQHFGLRWVLLQKP